jgi:hypothetical protein
MEPAPQTMTTMKNNMHKRGKIPAKIGRVSWDLTLCELFMLEALLPQDSFATP